MTERLKILFVPICAVGHVNACVGLAEVLRDSGHKIIFAVNERWIGKLTKYGFEEVLLSKPGMKVGEDPAAKSAQKLVELGAFKATSPLEKLIEMAPGFQNMVNMAKSDNEKIGPILKEIQPDVLMVDQFIAMPNIIKSGIPWVKVNSSNPLIPDDENTPPCESGLPINGDKNEWKEFRKATELAYSVFWEEYNEYLIANGVQGLRSRTLFLNPSEYLNIYGYPAELDYTDVRPQAPNYYQFDNLKRTEIQANFEIPEQLRGKRGKLIYFSMGSMGSADVLNMKRLIAILGKSKHRFIVSKGPLHSEYELADNMWGQQTVPQIQVLPVVDLVITHGGNNTVTETFYFGKPMILMPLFGDQYDNAQRVQEKGFGIRLDPNLCTEEELLNGIEILVNNKEMNEKLQKISERIQTENSIGKLPKLIEDLVVKNRKL